MRHYQFPNVDRRAHQIDDPTTNLPAMPYVALTCRAYAALLVGRICSSLNMPLRPSKFAIRRIKFGAA
jgi:hypothetical protein